MSQDQIYGLITGYLLTSIAIYAMVLLGAAIYVLIKKEKFKTSSKKGSPPVFKGNEITFPNAAPDENAVPPMPPPDDQPDQSNIQ